MICSASCEYAIRGLVQMARQPAGRKLSVENLVAKEQMPKYFLAKIFQRLAQHHILESRKGPGGGFALARSADQITLQDVVEAMEGAARAEQCVVGINKCDPEQPCPMHDDWQLLRTRVEDYLRQTTIAEIAASNHEGNQSDQSPEGEDCITGSLPDDHAPQK